MFFVSWLESEQNHCDGCTLLLPQSAGQMPWQKDLIVFVENQHTTTDSNRKMKKTGCCGIVQMPAF
ncbi:MAG: hypothetical protein HQM06_00065 [Magnetococcales bacterium]|nr:hypothetical protein [Magnetococcales bacterium]